eukprot:scaffold13521_cov164-Skeletonema_dohrnii-CCMP3373.AAC.4
MSMSVGESLSLVWYCIEYYYCSSLLAVWLVGGYYYFLLWLHLCFFAEWTEGERVADGIGATNIARKSCQNGVTIGGVVSTCPRNCYVCNTPTTSAARKN